MNIENLRDVLTDQLNFSPAYAKVYLYLLDKTKATVGEIIKDTKVAQTTVYESLRYFDDKNLVTSIRGKEKLYIVEPVSQLMKLYEEENREKEKRVKNTIEYFTKKEAEKRPSIVFYEGIEGIKRIREEINNDVPNKLYSVLNWDKIDKHLSKTSSFKGVREQDFPFKYRLDVIYSSKNGKVDAFNHPGINKLYTKEKLGAELALYGDENIIFIDYDSKEIATAIKITNKNIATTLKGLFSLAKKTLLQ